MVEIQDDGKAYSRRPLGLMGGGCRGSTYIYTGDMLAADQHCPYKPKE